MTVTEPDNGAAKVLASRRSLRRPMLRAIAALVIGLFVLLAIPLNYFFLGSFKRLEVRETTRNMERALNAITDETVALGRSARDYAQWDATYEYIAQPDQAYVDENFHDQTLHNNRLSFIALADLDGKIVLARAVDLPTRARQEPPPEAATVVGEPLRPLLRGPGRETGVEGLVLLGRVPALVGAYPIMKSDGSGPARGTVIFGRWLEAAEMKRLSERLRLQLEPYRLDAGLPPDVALARERLSPWSRTTTEILDDDVIAGYGLMTGLTGDPAVVLRVPQPREIWAQGFRAVLYLLLSLVVVGLAFAVLLVVALEKVVLSRVSALDREVREIGERGDVSMRVHVMGDDELGRLGARINEMLASVERLNRLLATEQQQSERLLLNVLPKPVAERLKLDGGVIADGYEDVSVIFADLVNFTKYASEMPASRLVEMLNTIFTHFDELADRHGLEKIKTIGDAYMVVSGLPQRRADHARAAARMALDMRSALFDFNAEHGTKFNLRIGIHCGPVVAGVIGRRKFIYDIWGDAVNTASRMESHGVPGEIQVSEEFRERVEDEFELQSRGTIQIKGMGERVVHLLLKRRVSLVTAPPERTKQH